MVNEATIQGVAIRISIRFFGQTAKTSRRPRVRTVATLWRDKNNVAEMCRDSIKNAPKREFWHFMFNFSDQLRVLFYFINALSDIDVSVWTLSKSVKHRYAG
jgi:hypothetical protein